MGPAIQRNLARELRRPRHTGLAPMRSGGGLRELCLRLRRSLGLVALLPFLVGHAVNELARFILAECDAALGSRLLIPVRQAVAAEAGEIHQIDVLDVSAGAQMLE